MYPLITIDYEIFGNGSGDLIKTVVEPMDRIRKVCDRTRAKVVIFFEVAEYLAMKVHAEKDPAFARKLHRMEEQVRSLREDGHGIDLHFHPQFVGAVHDGERFVVDESAYNCVALLEGLPRSQASRRMGSLLREGISAMKDMLRDGSYQPAAYRAGGWNFIPADVMIPVLRSLNVTIDSSGMKGAIMRSKRNTYDYRKLHDRLGYWWTAKDSIMEGGPPGENLMEMPIYSRPYIPIDPRKPFIHYKGMQLCAKHDSGSTTDPADLWSIYYSMISDVRWDFCKMDADTMWDFYKAAEAKDIKGEIKTMVMIGHTKEYNNDPHFTDFLRKADSKGVRFHTFEGLRDMIG